MMNLRGWVIMALAVITSACGDDDNGGTDAAVMLPDSAGAADAAATFDAGAPDATLTEAERFVGDWVFAAGSTRTHQCPGMPDQTIGLQGFGNPITIVADPVIRYTAAVLGCSWDYTVAGDTATILAGQGCATYPSGSGGSTTEVRDSSTMVLSADGASLVFTSSSTLGDGCTVLVDGTQTK